MTLFRAAADVGWPKVEAPISLWQATKTFGGGGVREVTMDVPAAEISVMIGPSGCGKTTTLQLLTGTYCVDSGRVRVLREDPRALCRDTRRQIGYVPQHYPLSKAMTVRDSMHFVSSLYGVPRRERDAQMREVLAMLDLDRVLDRAVGRLSGGEQRRVALANALAHQPSLIIADEPTAGLDPVRRYQIWQYFRELRRLGKTLFITTQYIGEVAFCDRVAVMRAGRLLCIETPIGLRRRAFGGDALMVRVAPAERARAAELVGQEPYVHDIRASEKRADLLYITVADAGSGLPRLVQQMSQHSINVQHVEEYKPTFDEVFMLLMKQYDQDTTESYHA